MARKNKPAQLIIDEQVAAREMAINSTLAEMIETVDACMNFAPLHVIEGRDTAPSWYAFPKYKQQFRKFSSWNEHWMGVLYPNTLECQQKIENNSSLVANLETDDDVDATYMDLCYDVQRFGFLLGYLAGCRAMGASKEEMTARARAFNVEALAQTRADLEAAGDARRT